MLIFLQNDLRLWPSVSRLQMTHTEISTKVRAKVGALLIAGDLVEEAKTGDEVSVVLDQTNFYAEMGGQVGDTGTLESEDLYGFHGTKRCGDFVLHMGVVESGTLLPGQPLRFLCVWMLNVVLASKPTTRRPTCLILDCERWSVKSLTSVVRWWNQIVFDSITPLRRLLPGRPATGGVSGARGHP